MIRMKLLSMTALWRAAAALSDAAGEAFCVPAAGPRADELDDLLAGVIRVLASVATGLEERSPGAKDGHLDDARRGLAHLGARLGKGEGDGLIEARVAREVRTRIREVVDEVDRERYRIRRKAS